MLTDRYRSSLSSLQPPKLRFGQVLASGPLLTMACSSTTLGCICEGYRQKFLPSSFFITVCRALVTTEQVDNVIGDERVPCRHQRAGDILQTVLIQSGSRGSYRSFSRISRSIAIGLTAATLCLSYSSRLCQPRSTETTG